MNNLRIDGRLQMASYAPTNAGNYVTSNIARARCWTKRHFRSFVGPSEFTFGSTKGGSLRNVIMHNVIWVNEKDKSCVYCWLRTLAMFDVTTCFPLFVGVSDVISRLLSKR